MTPLTEPINLSFPLPVKFQMIVFVTSLPLSKRLSVPTRLILYFCMLRSPSAETLKIMV